MYSEPKPLMKSLHELIFNDDTTLQLDPQDIFRPSIHHVSFLPTRHGRHSVTNHRQLNCLFDSIVKLTTIKTWKLHYNGLLFCGRNPSVIVGFHSQKVSNSGSAEVLSIVLMGLTPFVICLVSQILKLAKTPVAFFKLHSYLTSVTAAQIWTRYATVFG